MYQSILLAIDLDDESAWEKAVPVAIELARPSNANLHVLTVLPGFGMSVVGSFFPKDFETKATQSAAEALRAFTEAHIPGDVQVQRIVATGTVYEEIIKAAEEVKADVIVVTAHRPELGDYLLGPNAARVVRHASCSVVVVR